MEGRLADAPQTRVDAPTGAAPRTTATRFHSPGASYPRPALPCPALQSAGWPMPRRAYTTLIGLARREGQE